MALENAKEKEIEPGPEEGEAPTGYDISPEHLRQVERWLDENDVSHLEPLIDELHAADIADLLEKTDPQHRLKLCETFKNRLDAEVFSYLHSSVQEELIRQLEPRDVAAIVDELQSDDALELIEDLDEDLQRTIMTLLSGRVRALVEQGLTFPEDSAGRLIQREVIALPQFWTVGKTIDYMRADPDGLPDTFYDVFIVDPMHRVTGTVDLSRLLRSRRSQRLIDICETEFEAISPETDQEEVAFKFRQYGLVAAPVVNDDGRLLGVITIDDIVEVINLEAEEDILALAGAESGDLYKAVLQTTRSRFSWLFVNLLTAVLASVVIGMFDATLDQLVALAILMPIVASMGGNAGTQTLTVAVRALSTKELTAANAWRVIGKETAVGFFNGVLFAILIGAIAFGWFGSTQLGAIIAAAMIVNMLVAGFFGAIIPIALDRMKVDPAIASSVFLTTVTDVVGFLAFLGLATVFLL